MDKSRMAHRLAVILVSVLTVSLVFFSRVSEAMAQDCLEGRSFEVTVTNCVGAVFPDVYCFSINFMTVEALGCESSSAKIKCKASGSAKFKATVGGVKFKGKVQGSMIEGTALADDCESTFEGLEIDACPCPTPSGAQEETNNPYLP